MEQVRLYLPFTTAVLTSGVFHRDFGAKQIRYNGYHELAYLHPKRFSANKQIRKLLGVTEKENYFLLRFVSWNASHDKGKERISIKDKRDLINFLSKHGRVFITTEDLIDNEFEKFKIVLPPEMIHDVLSEAYIFIGEGATMASECAILGTPAIYINSLEAGTIDDQEEQGLLFHFRSFDGVLDKLVDLLNEENLKGKFRIKRNKMMRDKIDVTAFLVWFVEEFPGSSILMKKNPEYQNNFR
jgi:predicted glycosyltransferase